MNIKVIGIAAMMMVSSASVLAAEPQTWWALTSHDSVVGCASPSELLKDHFATSPAALYALIKAHGEESAITDLGPKGTMVRISKGREIYYFKSEADCQAHLQSPAFAPIVSNSSREKAQDLEADASLGETLGLYAVIGAIGMSGFWVSRKVIKKIRANRAAGEPLFKLERLKEQPVLPQGLIGGAAGILLIHLIKKIQAKRASKAKDNVPNTTEKTR